MTKIFNKANQRETRRLLRKEETEAEKIIWNELRDNKLGAKFRRQYGIGHYIADFCSPRNKLIIEIDGGVHTEDEQMEYDKDREMAIKELGFKILRFWNEEVINDSEKVLSQIRKKLK